MEKYLSCFQDGETHIFPLSEKDFQPVRYQRLPEIKDPHSMLFYDSYIYVVSTGTDRVIRYKYQDNSLLVDPEVVWCASNRKADTHHINSIISFEGEILISAFGPKSSKKWTSAKNGYIYNISQGKVLVENIYHPHTISVRNGDIYYCESRTSEFHSINKGYIDKFNGYLRGVTWLSDEFVCIGSSNRGKNNIVRKLLTRITKKDFIHGSSKLYLYNVRSKQILDIVDLSSNGPEVYDLLYVSNIITHDTISGLSS